MTKIDVRGLSLKKNGKTILDGINITLAPKNLTILVGPNGAGKSSLLKCLAGVSAPLDGSVQYDQQPLLDIAPDTRARKVAYLPQHRPLAWPCLVKDIVALGRFAYGTPTGRPTDQDRAAIESAMEKCAITHLANRRADTLSGGEVARMHCARAFATQAPMMLIDEPVAALDPKHQFDVMNVIRKAVHQGAGALVVLHDLTLAARYADRIIWMDHARIVGDGTVAETLTSDRIKDIFGLSARVSLADHPTVFFE